MNTATTEVKEIEIAMTNRRPLKINPKEWPIIARANWHDGEFDFQANYVRWINVREHADGRRIVYGAYTDGPGGAPIGFRGARAGYYIQTVEVTKPDESATVQAIRRVADEIGDEKLGVECISDLPAERV